MSNVLDRVTLAIFFCNSLLGGNEVTRSDNRDWGNARSWGVTSAVAAYGAFVAFFMRFVWSLTGGSTCVAMRT
jgi:hypothetical protein